MERLTGFAVLTSAHGRPGADLDALAEANLGDLIVEMDVNPIIAHERGAVAVDVFVVPRAEGGEP